MSINFRAVHFLLGGGGGALALSLISAAALAAPFSPTSDDPETIICRAARHLNADGHIDSADNGLVLGAWGSCPGCPADFDGDGDVGPDDLGYLLARWSAVEPCARPLCSEESESESLSLEGGPEHTIASALAMLGFASIESFVEWSREATLSQIEGVLAFVYVMVESGPES